MRYVTLPVNAAC